MSNATLLPNPYFFEGLTDDDKLLDDKNVEWFIRTGLSLSEPIITAKTPSKSYDYMYVGTPMEIEQNMNKSQNQIDIETIVRYMYDGNYLSKYHIHDLYLRYGMNEIWCLTDRTSPQILHNFDRDVVDKTFDINIDTCVFLIADTDIIMEEMPQYDKRIEV